MISKSYGFKVVSYILRESSRYDISKQKDNTVLGFVWELGMGRELTKGGNPHAH